MHAELNQAFHRIGAPIPGYMTFGLPDPANGDFRSCGSETRGGEILNFNQGSGFEGTSGRRFSGVVLSFRREVLEELAETSDLPVDLDAFAAIRAALPTSSGDTDNLRKRIAVSFDSTADVGQPGSRAAASLIHSEAAVSLLQLLSRFTERRATRRVPVRRRALARALDILETPEHFPVTVGDLCKLVGVSAPSLYRAFREEFGVGTKEYIKSRVLSAIRSELVAATPEIRVIDVANKWGIWHMGRFASEYRRQFGELPSETLRA